MRYIRDTVTAPDTISHKIDKSHVPVPRKSSSSKVLPAYIFQPPFALLRSGFEGYMKLLAHLTLCPSVTVESTAGIHKPEDRKVQHRSLCLKAFRSSGMWQAVGIDRRLCPQRGPTK